MLVENSTNMSSFNNYKGKRVVLTKIDGTTTNGILKEIKPVNDELSKPYYELTFEIEGGETVKIASTFCRSISESEINENTKNIEK